jgi:hypothetical protein
MLHAAKREGKAPNEMVLGQFLIREHIKVETALVKARRAHHEDCVRLLLAAGATQ